MDKKLLALIGILVIVLAGFYMSYTQGQNMNKKPGSQSPNPEGTTQQKQPPPTPATQSAGLIVEDIKVGEGTGVKSGDIVVIHYTGTFQNGEKFDSSIDRGEPFTTKIGVGEVIKGWDEGVVGMKVGGKRKLTIPPDLGYGSNAVGPIPANSTLVFELELLEIK